MSSIVSRLKFQRRKLLRTGLVGLGLFVLYFVGTWWGLPSEFAPAVDSPAPYSILSFFAEYSDATQASKYPAFHHLLQAPFYGVVLAGELVSGNLDLSDLSGSYPYGFRDTVPVFTRLILVSALISAVMTVGTILVALRLRSRFAVSLSHEIAVCLYAFSGITAYYARVGNFEAAYMFWLALSFLFIWKTIFEPDHLRRNLTAAAVFAAFAVASKDQAAGVVAGFGLIVLLVESVRSDSLRERFGNAVRFAVIMLIGYALVAILPQPARWVNHLSQWTLSSSNIVNFTEYPPTLSGHVDLLLNAVSDLAKVISPLGIVLALVGVVVLLSHRAYRELILAALPSISYYLIIIVPIRFVYERFMMPVGFLAIPLMAVGIGFLFTMLLRWQPVGRAAALVVGLVIVGYQVLFGYIPVTTLQAVDTKAQLNASLATFVPPGTPIMWAEGVTQLPNADTYRNYRLILPPDASGSLLDGSVRHIFATDVPDAEYVLADIRRLPQIFDDSIVATFTVPDWIRYWAAVPTAVQEYILYRAPGSS